MRIEARLPKDRNIPGVLRIVDERAVTAFSCPCLGKADNARARAEGNPTRDPLRRFGDTPLGLWRARIGRKMADTRTYGVHRVVTLQGLGGDALRACQNGRSGIWLHGGVLNMRRLLRPTFGCLRVADDHMAAILEILDRYFAPLPQLERWVILETTAA